MYVVLCHSESIRKEASGVSIMFGVLDCRKIQEQSVCNFYWYCITAEGLMQPQIQYDVANRMKK